jgi:hypothetical protein
MSKIASIAYRFNELTSYTENPNKYLPVSALETMLKENSPILGPPKLDYTFLLQIHKFLKIQTIS